MENLLPASSEVSRPKRIPRTHNGIIPATVFPLLDAIPRAIPKSHLPTQLHRFTNDSRRFRASHLRDSPETIRPCLCCQAPEGIFPFRKSLRIAFIANSASPAFATTPYQQHASYEHHYDRKRHSPHFTWRLEPEFYNMMPGRNLHRAQ